MPHNAPTGTSGSHWYLFSSFVIAGIALLVAIGLFVWEARDSGDTTTSTTNTASTNTVLDPANANMTNVVVANANVAPTLDPVPAASDLKTVTYQKADHGFAFEIPATWNAPTLGPGTEDYNLVYSYLSSEDYYLDFYVNYFANTEVDLESWVTKHIADAKGSVTSTPAVINGQEAFLVSETTPADDWTPGLLNRKAYIISMDGNRVYAVSINSYATVMEAFAEDVTGVLTSFRFINTIPMVSITAPATTGIAPTTGSTALTISWLDVPAALNISDPMTDNADNGIYSRDYYRVGSITGGRYAGDDLVLVLESLEGPYFDRNLYRVAFDDDAGTFVYLEKYSDTLEYFYSSFTYDQTATIADYDALPAEIAIPSFTTTLREETFNHKDFIDTIINDDVVFTDVVVGQVWYDADQNCFFIEMPDHLIKRYYLYPPFVTGFTENDSPFSSSVFTPTVTWTGGTANVDEYSFNEPRGCGFTHCQSLFTTGDLGDEDVLTPTGTTITGDTIYAYADTDNDVLKDTYDMFYVEGDKPSYEAFIADHPIFFWQDPFGNWLRFMRTDYLPAVECGKPVIYLYPEEPTTVNVQVDPTGGFTATDPVYPDGGWTVDADPSGTLTVDGQVYSSLFWEGIGLNYERPDEGFMVARSDVPSFLQSTLARLGLNEQERSDFIDFWAPRMTDKPWYFVTFVDQQVFDELAPLVVSPTPDSIIRVFMDYEGLNQPRSVTPLDITTPARDGFIVVEWGGALHR